MLRPVLLDMFCGGGGAGMGYYRAGFDVVGIDIKAQPHYPCYHDADYASHFKFYQADALEFPLEGYDAYHASPPCYENTWSARRWIDAPVCYEKTDQLVNTRKLLLGMGVPFILENTTGAEMEDYIRMDGTMFGLKVIRERWFELYGFEILLLPSRLKVKRPVQSGNYFTVAGHGGNSKDCRLTTWQEAMGIDWMTKYELTQAIPPAYTEFIGKYLMQAVMELK